MKTRHLLPLVALGALAACASTTPPARHGSGWSLLDTCWTQVTRKTCPNKTGADLDQCMAPLIARFNEQRDAEGQRALVVQQGCPTYIAGGKP